MNVQMDELIRLKCRLHPVLKKIVCDRRHAEVKCEILKERLVVTGHIEY